MRGDDDAASTPAHAHQQSGSFAGAGLYWRIAIVAAGPAANFILGIALFAAVYMSVGTNNTSCIGDVVPDMPAAQAGLQRATKFLKLMGLISAILMICVVLLSARASFWLFCQEMVGS